MSGGFDPYYKWLGIPPKDQPAHHYRLLGVELFESDREVIDAAANRLMAFLQDLSTGEDAAPAQKLLNEISAARLCLLHPHKKAGYDKLLRAKLQENVKQARPVSPQPPPPPQGATPVAAATQPARAKPAHAQATPPPGAPLIVTESDSPAASSTRRRKDPRGATPRRDKSGTTMLLLFLLGAAALATVGAAVYTLAFTDALQPRSEVQPSVAPTAPVADSVIELQWPESERRDAKLQFDRRAQLVPALGPLRFEVAAGSHRVAAQRTGFAPILHRSVRVASGETVSVPMRWTASPRPSTDPPDRPRGGNAVRADVDN